MTAVLGIIQFVFISYILIYEFKSKSSATFLWATLFIMFGTMHLLASFSGDTSYNGRVLSEASLFVIFFCFFYLITRYLLGTKNRYSIRDYFYYDELQDKINNEFYNDKILFILFCGVIFLETIPLLKYAGNIFSVSWSVGRKYNSTLNYMNSQQIYKVLYYSMAGLVSYYYIKKQRALYMVMTLLIIIKVLLTRNRIEILPLLCSVITIFIYKNKRINLKVVILGGIGTIAIIYVVYGLVVFRHYGTINDFLTQATLPGFIEKINSYIQEDNGELGLRRVFYYFIDNNNQFESFGKGHTYIRMLLVYIPTSWSFGLKPDDFAIAMGKAYGMMAGQSTHPTLFGDCYANFEIFGVLLGSFWAIYATLADNIAYKQKTCLSSILVYILNSVVYVIIGRGSVYNGFWFVAYGVPMIMLIDFIRVHIKINIIWSKKGTKSK